MESYRKLSVFLGRKDIIKARYQYTYIWMFSYESSLTRYPSDRLAYSVAKVTTYG